MSAHVFQRKVIATPESLGKQFKDLRVKKKKSITMAEHDTKVRSHYLKAIENDMYGELPSSHAKGFIRRYGQYLGMSPDMINQAIERLMLPSQTKQPFSPIPLQKESRWYVTPRMIFIVLIIAVLFAFVGYVTYQVRRFASPPALVITSPAREMIVTTETFTIEGQTDPGSIVTVDNLQATVGGDGNFSYPITLRPGVNQITVRSENRIEKQATVVVSILYQPPTQ
jgi:hypothetical protein